MKIYGYRILDRDGSPVIVDSFLLMKDRDEAFACQEDANRIQKFEVDVDFESEDHKEWAKKKKEFETQVETAIFNRDYHSNPKLVALWTFGVLNPEPPYEKKS